MSRGKVTLVSILVAAGLLLAVGAGVRALSPANYAVDWELMGGGGEPISSASTVVDGTLGQATIGASHSARYVQGGGFWYVAAAPVAPPEYRVYLPGVWKSQTLRVSANP